MTEPTGSGATLKAHLDEWLRFFDWVRATYGDKTADIAQDAYLIGRKVGFQEGREDV